MGLNGSVATPDGSPCALASGRVAAAAVTFFALAAAAPIVGALTTVPEAYAWGAGPLVPLTFAAVTVVLLLFTTGYRAMARRVPSAGALYAQVARGLGRPGGVGAAWLALAGYGALQLGFYGLAGAAAAPLLRGWFQLSAPWWAVAGGCWAFVALCGTIRVEVASGVLALSVLAEITVVAGFAAADLLQPAGGRITAGSILPSGPATADPPVLGLLAVAGVLAFIGFETAGAYAEEALRPRREAGRAAYAAVICLGLLLIGSSWSMSIAAGPGQVAGLARARGSELVFDLAAARLAPWAVTLGRVMLCTGLIAAMLSLHYVISRYLFALGRERVLPGFLGRTARRTGAPRAASVTQSLVVGALLAAGCLAGLGAPVVLARRLTAAGGLGILVLLLAASLAALLHLNRAPGGERAWVRFPAPALSTVALGALAYAADRNLPELLGVVPPKWTAPAVLGGVLLLGLLHAALLRGTRPSIYAGIGHAGAPLAVAAKAEVPPPRDPGAHRPERVNQRTLGSGRA
jgi:amino acid transporter